MLESASGGGSAWSGGEGVVLPGLGEGVGGLSGLGGVCLVRRGGGVSAPGGRGVYPSMH